MKKLLLLALLGLALSAKAQQPPGGCITNMVLTPVNGSTIIFLQGTNSFQTNGAVNLGNISGSVGYSCGDSPSFTVYNPCQTYSRVAATLSWQCYALCGPGGNISINLPGFGDECPVWIQYCNGCCLTLCQGDVRYCEPGGEE